MTNAWLTHLKKFRQSHPNMSVTEAAKAAKKTYKKKKQAGSGFFNDGKVWRDPGIVPNMRGGFSMREFANSGQRMAGILKLSKDKLKANSGHIM